MGYGCELCRKLICKYWKDLGDTIEIKVSNKGKYKLICDDCAKKIAKQLIER